MIDLTISTLTNATYKISNSKEMFGELTEIKNLSELVQAIQKYQVQPATDLFNISEIFEHGGTFAYYPSLSKVPTRVPFFVYKQPSKLITWNGHTYGPRNFSEVLDVLQPTEKRNNSGVIVGVTAIVIALAITIFVTSKFKKRKENKK